MVKQDLRYSGVGHGGGNDEHKDAYSDTETALLTGGKLGGPFFEIKRVERQLTLKEKGKKLWEEKKRMKAGGQVKNYKSFS